MKNNEQTKIIIGVDHRGYNLKQFLLKQNNINDKNIKWIDVGTYSNERTDYPIFAHAAIKKIISGEAHLGILACGTGIGMAVVANRYQGIYAGLVWNQNIARLAKEDDNVNVLVLPSDFVSNQNALLIIKSWLSAKFKSGRYEERINMIDSIK